MSSPLRQLASHLVQSLEGQLIEGSFGTEGWAQAGGETPIVDHRLLARLLARRNRKFLENIHAATARSAKLLELRSRGVHVSEGYRRYLQNTLVVLVDGKSAREVEVGVDGEDTVVKLHFRSKLIASGGSATCSLFPENSILTID